MKAERYSKEDIRILESFWNKKRKKIRTANTSFLIALDKIGDFDSDDFMFHVSLIGVAMVGMVEKGLVKPVNQQGGVDYWSLTEKGRDVLLSKHPRLKNMIENLIESTPLIIIIISGIIGFLASITGLLEWFDKIKHPILSHG